MLYSKVYLNALCDDRLQMDGRYHTLVVEWACNEKGDQLL